MAKVKLGLQDNFELGNLDAKRDWGFAGDYVEAMWLILQQKKPDDFVIASGESHTVRDCVNVAAKALGMSLTWQGKGLKEIAKDAKTGKIIVKVNKAFYRPAEVHHLQGDSSKARKVLGWKPKVSFEKLIEQMAKADYESLKATKGGSVTGGAVG